MSDNKFDIIVIGSGPGGYVAAVRASQLGMKVAIVEKEHLGGICLNWGCIPTKALLRSAEMFRYIKSAKTYGLSAEGIDFDLKAIVKRSRTVSKRLNMGVKQLLKGNNVEVLGGIGRLSENKGEVLIEDKEGNVQSVTASNIILATGARARQIPRMEVDDNLIWDYKNAMTPEEMPKSLLVVGSGAIGVEFASFYNAFGVEVTIVEAVDTILPVEDEEISAFAHKSLKKQGMNVITSAFVTSIEKGDGFVTAVIKEKNAEESIVQNFDRVIMAVGVVCNTENIGLEKTAIKLENGHVVVDEWLQTDEAGVYAIGDLVAPPYLAHKASHEALICVEKIAGKENVKPLDKTNIPGATYCNPQIANVGLSEKEAVKQGYNVKIGRFNYIGNGKAMAMDEKEGFVKVVTDSDTGKILGVHIVGAEAPEMIHSMVLAKGNDMSVMDVVHNTVFPHPTLSEILPEALLSAFDKPIHG
ncbi:MAG: dihydrolipoyl dehydrogenase [Alphaproteobacteria bacterium]|nr:dihydrolipoyl dehydrogenase [Alphaproteobacteria bacterium]